MPNATETATTPHQVRGRLWQDNHSGLRRHKLMTKELGENIPALYANENVEDYDAVLAPVKLFSAPTATGPGTSPSGTPRPEPASASWMAWRRSLATLT